MMQHSIHLTLSQLYLCQINHPEKDE
ncbi:hypothetical protein F383_33693 [Gossypium arboreum]|uniref:Uncharacterized protein n=1 Tax=Gossypium arboreum TaxID=29729 RepID=A0A0B0N1R6_GOSAR|nr:hypothetical protein F383_33693 [Gossypium arboreum]